MKRTVYRRIIIVTVGILLISGGLIIGCRNPLRNADGSADAALTLIMPDYFSGVSRSISLRDSSQPRIIDPDTHTIDISVSGEDMETMKQRFSFQDEAVYADGRWIVICNVRNIPAGPARTFLIETRNASGELLTAGTITLSLILGQENDMSVPLVPAEPEEVGPDETLSGAVSYGRMEYHKVTFPLSGTYRISVTSDVDVDLYLYDETCTLLPESYWERAVPTDEDAVIQIDAAETTMYIGVFGNTLNTDAAYTVSIFSKVAEIQVVQAGTDIPSGTGSYDFGSVHVDGDAGAASDQTTFTVRNTGSGNLIISDIRLSDGNTADFDLTDSAASTVVPGAETSFSIRLDPLTGGNKSATLTIENNDYDEGEYSFALTGVGKSGDLSGLGRYADITTIINPWAVAVSPDGNHIYVADPTGTENGGVVWFSRNSTTGNLTYMNQYNHADIDGTDSVAVSPDGENVYTVSSGLDSVAWFTRNSTTGALTYGNRITMSPELDAADHVTVSPDGNHVYVSQTTSLHHAVTWLSRNPSTGDLTFIDWYASVNIDGAEQIIITPDGKNAYIPARWANHVARFTRNDITGNLTYEGYDDDNTLCGNPTSVAVSPDNNHLYFAANSGNAVGWFTRNTATGALTYGNQYQNAANLDGASWVTLSPDGNNVYVTGADSYSVVWLTRDPDTGDLTYEGEIIDSYLQDANCAVVSPDGNHLYVTASGSGSVLWFSRN